MNEKQTLKPLMPVIVLALAIAAAFIVVIGCSPATTSTTPTAVPTFTSTKTPVPTSPLSPTQLKYRIVAHFGGVFYCDPDYYPIAREGQEEQNAVAQFPSIQAGSEEFTAILEALGLKGQSELSLEQKVAVYREHKKLLNVRVETAAGEIYNFGLRIGDEGKGFAMEGTITRSGDITVLKKEPSINMCPICLAGDTLIDTPEGAVRVRDLHEGMAIWTVDERGTRVASIVVWTVKRPVPGDSRLVRIVLSDGRTLTASPRHLTFAGRPLGSYLPGELLDSAAVVALEYVPLGEAATYDLLPAGATGVYWANGIPLESTLMPVERARATLR